VRVTPYRAVGTSADPAYAPSDDLEVAGVPSAAPAPTARGWKSLDSYWVRLAVPVVREQGRLVVDTWDASLDATDPARRPGPAADRPDAERIDLPRPVGTGTAGPEPAEPEPAGPELAEPTPIRPDRPRTPTRRSAARTRTTARQRGATGTDDPVGSGG
jgi:hypothetical protein